MFIVFSGAGTYPGGLGGLCEMMGELPATLNRILQYNAGGALLQMRDSLGNTKSLATTNTYPIGTCHILGATLTTGTGNFIAYKDGAVNGSIDGFTLKTGVGAMEIARGHTTTYQYKGDIAEFLLYNSALSDANRVLVETYLADKWGIALP